jgi:O-antigen ligase
MAVHTKHPASARPTAPVRETTRHLLLRGWCIFVLFQAIAGVAWINAFGDTVTVVVTIASGVVSAILWAMVRPPVQWRRLPWFIVAYVVFAALSILWSAWPATTAITLLLLVITTIQGMFVGSVLAWRELVRAIASALKWAMALSILFELWVSIFVGVPVLPGFVPRTEPVDPILYWSRNNLFDGGRIQGIWGNANLLGIVALLAIIVFSIRFAARAPRRVLLGAWIALSAYLMLRAASATAFVAAGAAALVLVTVLLMRTARRPGERTKYYVAYAIVGIGAALVLTIFRQAIFTALGRDSDLTGRERIWEAVLERASERPIAGWGFATPWLTSDPHFDEWIVDHGQSVMQAHNMWVDVYLQLGVIGVTILGLVYLALVWRSWFFAVDRPRWDLRDDRPYSPLSLLPTLVVTILLVQGLAESGPLLTWGWMFAVMLSHKLKQSPHIGEGPAEQSYLIEQGETEQAEPAKRRR